MQRHIADSLQLKNHLDYSKDVIVDIGSGAGFPGMVLAIDGAANVSLVEPIGKKVVFLNHIKNIYQLNVTIYQCTWQQLANHNATAVLSRAYASLDNLLKAMIYVSRETISPRGIFLKGEKLNGEIRDAQQNWSFCHETYPSTSHANGKIIKVWDVSKK